MNPKMIHRVAIATWILSGACLFGISDLTSHFGDSARVVWPVYAWTIWVLGVFLMLIPSTVGLVIVRTITPLAVIGAFAGFFIDSVPGIWLIGFVLTVASLIVVFSAEFGHVFVNGSAYGDEIRFLLRPPVQYLLPLTIAWLLLVAPVAVVGACLASKQWWLAVVVGLFAIPLALLMTARLGKLAARWLVLVPAGLVIHDKMVLAETVMFRRLKIREIQLAPANTDAADLTGVTWGIPLQVNVSDGDKIIFRPDKEHPNGRAIHVYGMLVAPSRPGLFISSWKR